MQKIRLSIVSYINTLPFLYGINQSEELLQQIEMHKDIPSVGANKMKNNFADLGLIPVGALLDMNDYQIVSDFCLATDNVVKTVKLISQKPLHEIKNIYLDYQSVTSRVLLKILAKEYWKISPEYLQSNPGYEEKIEGETAGLIIGDRAFKIDENKFKYVWDLGIEWNSMTGLPFVFAVWIANKPIDIEFLSLLNRCIGTGLTDIQKVIQHYRNSGSTDGVSNETLVEYYTENMSYVLDDKKREAMRLFFEKAKSLNL